MVMVDDLSDDGKTKMENVATNQAVAEFQSIKPQKQALVPTLIGELNKLRCEN